MKKSVLILLLSFGILGVSFCQTANYEIYALRFADVGQAFPLSALAMDAPAGENVNAVFSIWLIKGNGKNILVDAGFLNDIPEAKDFSVVRYIRPDSAIIRFGLQPADISDIILTHPHWDHIDGVSLFPNAQVWMQKDDYNYFVGSAWQKGGNKGGFNERDVRMMLDLNLGGRLHLVDGDSKELLPGITVYTGSRHTYNSEYVLVKTGNNKVVLASDNAYTYYNIDHLKSAPPNSTFDTAGYVKQLQRMKTLVSDPKYIIPGHDAAVFTRFPTVKEGVVRIR
ncbi:MAG: hydrolase glyoxylase [Bacteroidetes bacterium]|nr:MAG: hydrolase glyoxylase [Bacteroidota bacterium]